MGTLWLNFAIGGLRLRQVNKLIPQAINFSGPGGELEGIVSVPRSSRGPFQGMVICHSFPFLGENMSSRSVYAIAEALDSNGIATLRFNFRGVGFSGGRFDNGKGEQDDLKSAVETFRRWPNVKKNSVGVVGISFGSVVALDALAKLKNISSLVLISPTSGSIKRSTLKSFRGTKSVIIAGSRKMSSVDASRADVASQFREDSIKVIEEADNSWIGYENQLADSVLDSINAGNSKL